MKITLKKVKLYPEISEETLAYSADLYIDGKLTAQASNRGQGEADLYTPTRFGASSNGEAQARIRAAEEFFSQKTVTFESGGRPYTMKGSLEIAVGEVLAHHESATQLRKRMGKHVVFVDSNGYTIFEVPARPADREKVAASIERDYPGCKILNGMTTDQLVEAVAEADEVARKKEAAEQSGDDLSKPSSSGKVDPAPSPG